MKLPLWNRFTTHFKCFISYLFFPLAIIIVWPFFFLIMRYRIRELDKVRQQFATLVQDKDQRPILICLNHLTRIDSMILATVATPLWKVFFRYSYLPWHVLDYHGVPFFATLCAFVKTIPIERMGDRRLIQLMQERVRYLLSRGNLVVIFPEGRRSLDGRVMTEDFQYGVGTILKDIPDCRVLCVYLRADKQEGRSAIPPAKSDIYIAFEMITPTTSLQGLRAARDLAGQIVVTLDSMEKKYFAEKTVGR